MLIDLTHHLNEETPVYPGDPRFSARTAHTVLSDGFMDHEVTFGTHLGTHLDAPAHFIDGGASLSTLPLERFQGRGVIVPFEGLDARALSERDIRAGDFVLFYSGMSERYGSPSYFTEYPSIPLGVADVLVAKKVGAVGVDTASVDTDPFPVHKLLLGNGILIIENLTNLSQVRADAVIRAFPPKVALDGFPVRVVAEWS